MKRALIWTNILLFALTCLFVFSPLRLNTDSIRLFVMSLPAALGGAYGVDQFPPFYPHLLCGLMKMGLCNSVVLMGINFLAWGIALLILHRIFRLNGCSEIENLSIILFCQLNWCIAKHLLLPQTDILLLPVFWGCILTTMKCQRASSIPSKYSWLAFSLILAFFALSIRIAAIPLFGLVGVAALNISPDNIRGLIKKRSFWIVFGGLSAFTILVVWGAVRFTGFADEGGYLSLFKAFASGAGLVGFLTSFKGHLVEIASLIFNMSPSRVPLSVMTIGSVGGPLLLCLFSFKFFHKINWYLVVIVIGYGLEIILWPCHDSRFLLPILPFVAIPWFFAIKEMVGPVRKRFVRVIGFGYVICFSVLGIVSWGWLARQWTWGKDFYKTTPSIVLSVAYKNAFQKRLSSISPAEKNMYVFLLKKFDVFYAESEATPLSLHDSRYFPLPPFPRPAK